MQDEDWPQGKQGMNGSSYHIALMAVAWLLLSACSGPTLLTRHDYEPSRQALSNADIKRAIDDLPRGEKGGFITTMERTYLELLQGRPSIEPLAALAAKIDDLVHYQVSREARSFFYLKTPDDYYPGEHEIVWMHLMLSWGYALRSEYEKSCVEIRIADSLLDYTRRPAGRFDDPMLRLMAAALWAACGDWEESRVDLRAAVKLDSSLKWAKQLAEIADPPAELVVVLAGTGPEPYWDPTFDPSLLRAGRNVAFKFSGQKSQLVMTDRDGLHIAASLSPDVRPWYERHFQRNNAIEDLIQDSHFGKDITTEGAIAGLKIGGTGLLGVGLVGGSIVVGGGIAYAGLEAGNGDLFFVGLFLGGVGVKCGMEMIADGIADSANTFNEEVDPSPRYRMVRFLPEYLWFGVNDAPLSPPLAVRGGNEAAYKLPTQSFGKSVRVTILYYPDVQYSWPNNNVSQHNNFVDCVKLGMKR